MPANANSVGAIGGGEGTVVVNSELMFRVTNISVNPQTTVDQWGDSDSQGHTNTFAARKMANVTLTGKMDSNSKIWNMFVPGDTLLNVGCFETQDTGADYWAFPRLVCETYTETIDPDTKNVIEWTATFSTDGLYYKPGQTGAPSIAIPS